MTNDCATGDQGAARVPHQRSLHNAEIILRAAAAFAPTLMIGPPPVLGDKEADTRLRRLSDDLATLCHRLGIPFLETASFISQCETWRRETLAGDGAHPNKNGYAALAEFIAAWPGYNRWLS